MSTATPTLKRDERKAETRRALIEAASDLFARQGIEATSIDEIAASVGLTKGAVYAHFANKGELVEETLNAAGLSLGGNEFFETGDLAGFFTQVGCELAKFLPSIPRQGLLLFLEYLLYVMRDPQRHHAERLRTRSDYANNGRTFEEKAAAHGMQLPLTGAEITTLINATGLGIALTFLIDERAMSRSTMERFFAAIGYGLQQEDAVNELLSTRPST